MYKRLQMIDASRLVYVEVYMLGKHELYMLSEVAGADNILAAVRCYYLSLCLFLVTVAVFNITINHTSFAHLW